MAKNLVRNDIFERITISDYLQMFPQKFGSLTH